MNFLFHSGMTFHYRSLLPIMKRLSENGHSVNVLSKGYFTEKRIRNKPRSLNIITKKSLEFVCEQSGLDKYFLGKVHFCPYVRRLNIPSSTFFQKQDMFISTTKGFPWLNQMAKYKKPRVAIAYQNILRTYFTTNKDTFPDNCLPNLEFEEQIINKYKINSEMTGLPFIDAYMERSKYYRDIDSRKVLLLHPGGYRGVITKMGESKKLSYIKQLELYENLISYIPDHLKLTIKIHPLAAKYHDLKFHKENFSHLGIDFIEGFLGDYLFEYYAVLSIGSSALYEVLRFKPLWILNYFSKERTDYYKDLPSLFINSGEDLYEKLRNREHPKLNNYFENRFIDRLKKTADGNAINRVLNIIHNIKGKV